ncbi:GyrI-like domain-containing protein [Rhodopirellula sallentina]|uniref:AraC family transcriptional regulator n=1 Tax=Rhodopirellula sallentina SM41 TaxID=1263870 RepID=M5U082_9BACT|nr:effector binding domain-containing protein [Rhodopirellula sallentina]EMI54860.1 AraC family transcriptional regulator [Rhodopirellula sallentina SM41]
MNIIQQYARTLYGIEARIDGDPVRQIGAVWDRFLTENLAEDCPSRLDDNLVALYCDYEGDHTQPYTFFLGCEVLDVCSAEDGFAIRYTPVGNYAEFSAFGAMPDAVIDKWREIWEMELYRNYIADYEIHDPKSPNEVSVYVGVM